MLKSKLKIIIDTNLWISFLISGKLKWIDQFLLNNTICLIFSQELLDEFISVATRPKFSKYFDKKDMEEFFQLLEEYAAIVPVKSDINICRDSKDNFLLSLSVDSKADYLITGDIDLLELKYIEKTQIITLLEFKKLFK